MNVGKLLLPAASIGLGALLVKPTQRGLSTAAMNGPPSPPTLIPQAAIEEQHTDELMISDHPIELGAAISDHAFKRPAEVTIQWGWSNSPTVNNGLLGVAMGMAASLGGPVVGNLLAAGQTISAVGSLLSGNSTDQAKAIYQSLLALQTSRTLVNIYTGKRVYQNMLIQSLHVTTDVKTENALLMQARCREIQIATTQVVNTSQINGSQSQVTDPAKCPPQNQGQVQAAQATPPNGAP